MQRIKPILRKSWWAIPVAGVALALVWFLVWAETPLGPMPEALAALQADSLVQVETQPWLVFHPTSGQPDTAAIIYPGGRVDPRSYAPVARALASNGYLVVITPMPLNLAVFAPKRAMQVIDAYPDIRNWAIGGHSLGGAMAANFINREPSEVDGLFLWAAYPASSDDLSSSNLLVISVYATLDGLATLDKIEASRTLLPAGTIWVAIQGGNHAQFGWYGEQDGDNPATISREKQQEQVIQSTLELLMKIDE
ncbi:MAG: alpha/beta hydrolase [Anaerolineales bacterium]|nr:alpha/beta hydrolase [Anaerolineales bacterium]